MDHTYPTEFVVIKYSIILMPYHLCLKTRRIPLFLGTPCMYYFKLWYSNHSELVILAHSLQLLTLNLIFILHPCLFGRLCTVWANYPLVSLRQKLFVLVDQLSLSNISEKSGDFVEYQ